MRTEQQMMGLIMGTAKNDERIRAVIMNGSRTSPSAPKDFFQDFDIVYVVRDYGSFTANHSWIDLFGQIMIMQMPSRPEDGFFTYLMQFMDGNRIDLTLVPAERAAELIKRDSQSLLLLDKDNAIEPFPPASDADYLITMPGAAGFEGCCNEFWWMCPYVAKGIWRDELPYAMYMYERYVRDMLSQMVKWYIGTITYFSVSAGKGGKYFKKYLPTDLWQLYVRTYSDANYDNLWNALFDACSLFRRLAVEVARYFEFSYPHADDTRVSAHLAHVRNLPRDARSMY